MMEVPLLVIRGERNPVVPRRFRRRAFGAAVSSKRAIWHAEALRADIQLFGRGRRGAGLHSCALTPSGRAAQPKIIVATRAVDGKAAEFWE